MTLNEAETLEAIAEARHRALQDIDAAAREALRDIAAARTV
jgi:alpha-beta hydrolase superfamily lysophospholipase